MHQDPHQDAQTMKEKIDQSLNKSPYASHGPEEDLDQTRNEEFAKHQKPTELKEQLIGYQQQVYISRLLSRSRYLTY